MKFSESGYRPTGIGERESFDTETEVREIYRMLGEMDKAKQRKLTLSAREYIEGQLFDDAGKIRPQRLPTARKLVETVYFGEYAKVKALLSKEVSEQVEEVEKRDVFNFPEIREAGYPHHFLKIFRGEDKTWSTTSWGGAYSTTCDTPPQWLLDLTPEWDAYTRPSEDNNYLLEKQIIIDGVPVDIERHYRPHENGVDFWQHFSFASKEAATKFTHWLNKKETETNAHFHTPEEKVALAFDYSGRAIIDWSRLDLFDPSYFLLADSIRHTQTMTNYGGTSTLELRGENLEKFSQEHGVSVDQLCAGAQKFCNEINRKLLELTEPAVKQLEESAEYKDLPYHHKTDSRQQEVRQQAVTETMLRTLLEGWQEKIIQKAKGLQKTPE